MLRQLLHWRMSGGCWRKGQRCRGFLPISHLRIRRSMGTRSAVYGKNTSKKFDQNAKWHEKFQVQSSAYGLNKPLVIGEFASVCSAGESIQQLFEYGYNSGYQVISFESQIGARQLHFNSLVLFRACGLGSTTPAETVPIRNPLRTPEWTDWKVSMDPVAWSTSRSFKLLDSCTVWAIHRISCSPCHLVGWTISCANRQWAGLNVW